MRRFLALLARWQLALLVMCTWLCAGCPAAGQDTGMPPAVSGACAS